MSGNTIADAKSYLAPGRSKVSSFIVVADAKPVIAFAKEVFGATELRPPLYRSNGRLWNLELDLAGHTVMIGEESPENTHPSFLYIHVEDVDAVYARALAAGASPVMPPENRFYGDRDGGVMDAAGNLWWIATHVEDVPQDEQERRAKLQDAGLDWT